MRQKTTTTGRGQKRTETQKAVRPATARAQGEKHRPAKERQAAQPIAPLPCGCGATAEAGRLAVMRYRHPVRACVICIDCGCSGPLAVGGRGAIEAWNSMRQGSSPQRGRAAGYLVPLQGEEGHG